MTSPRRNRRWGGHPRGPTPEPKPFVWVRLPTDPPQRKEPATHERFTGLTGHLELSFTVVSDHLFVGSGFYEFNPNPGDRQPDVWQTFYRREGQVCVPGTGLKGAIRALVEAISNSCVSQHKRGERVPQSHERCRGTKLCPACGLFGTTGLRGRVSFADALADPSVETQVVKIAELWPPKRFAGRKFYQTKWGVELSDLRPQKNFRFVEAVPQGSRFRTVLYFENLAEVELGLLAYALGWEPRAPGGLAQAFPPKLGGAKPRCFGAVTFQCERVVLWELQPNGLLTKQEVQGSKTLQMLNTWMEQARASELLHLASWEVLSQELRPQEDRTCPREVY